VHGDGDFFPGEQAGKVLGGVGNEMGDVAGFVIWPARLGKRQHVLDDLGDSAGAWRCR